MKSIGYLLSILFFSVLCTTHPTVGHTQNTPDTTRKSVDKIDLYLDCNYCARNYIKSNITFVNYVRDRTDADVQLIITSARTGGSGRQFTLQFYGRGTFKGKNDTLTYFSPETDTDDLRRERLVKHIKIGLMSYVASSPLASQIDISYDTPEDTDNGKQKDPWNSWMFEIGSNFSANGRRTHKSFSYYGSGSAERITEKWKIRYNLYTNIDWDRFIFDSRPDRTTRQISHGYHGIIAKSLTDHWSVGVYSNAESSTYDNMDFSASISPAFEYNIFPYSEHNTREISFRYRITPRYNNYEEETIFFKYEEYLVRHVGSIRVEYTQPWGEIDLRIRGSHLLRDIHKNHLSFNGSVEFELVKGLSLDFYGNYSIINDQISISREGASYEEVLLNLRQQATSYSFYGRIGISYSFGAIYNNVVNPRF